MANSLLTAAMMILWKEGSSLGGVLPFISYLCLATMATHGTRKEYEKLKAIYVYPNERAIAGKLADGLLLALRIIVVTAPILIVWWAYAEQKLPF